MPDYQVSGEGAVTLYLLHGIYGSKEYWRFLTERLVARGYRVVAWDAPGYGLSPLPDPFSFDVVAQAGATLIRATGTKRNVVFGQSMGGQIAPRIRLKAPDMVHGLVICSTIGYFGNRTKEEQEEFVRKRTGHAHSDSAAANVAVVDSLRAKHSAGPEVEFVREVAARTAAKTVEAAVAAVRSYPEADAVATIRAVSVPTLLVAGAEDETAPPSTMRRVADMIANAEFCVVSKAAHYPWAENIGEFDRCFFDFLEKHFGPGVAVR
jgi:pimeloyl-ACP methyl ester carboxylesterase